MFNWEKLELFGIEKADKDLIETNDGIHCSVCGEHLGNHGVKDGVLLHPLDIANIINKE
jgi:hypothetical protein